MGGLARSYGKEYSDDEGGIAGETCFQDLISHWLDVGVETGMPMDPRIWTKNPISSTYPACLAAKAASEQGEAAAGSYLRRVREGLMHERRRLDHADALLAVAGEAGLDLERFGRDVHSNAMTEAFAADLDEVRDIPPEVREQGKVRHTEGRERVPFPSAVFIGEDGARHGVWALSPMRPTARRRSRRAQRREGPRIPTRSKRSGGSAARRPPRLCCSAAGPARLSWRTSGRPPASGS